MPSTPAPVVLKHWSIGDTYAEQRPPTQKAEANVKWLRMFFNSSLMAKEDHLSFDSTCHSSLKCSMNDTTLRGSTPYISESTAAWKEPPAQNFLRLIPAWICAGCIIITIFLLIHALILRKLASISKEPNESVDYSDQSQLTLAAMDSTGHNTGTTTSLSAVRMDGDDLNIRNANDYSSHNSHDGGSMTAWGSTGNNSKSIALNNYSATAEHLTK